MPDSGETNNYVDLEVILHSGPHVDRYSVKLSATKPEGLPVDHNGTAEFDIRRLVALSNDPLSYAQLLTKSLFNDPAVFSAFNQARGVAQADGGTLRVRLILEPSAHNLHALHWEALLDPQGEKGSYLFNSTGRLYYFRGILAARIGRP